MPNTPFIEQLGQQAATQVSGDILGAGMGMILGSYNDKRQLKQQAKLQALQMQGNKEMLDYQKMKDFEMWQKTGPMGMIQEYKKAGLNPALAYGMTGGGGQTTSGGGPTVTGANAPSGGREIQEMTGQALQYALLDAQRANIEAATEKTKVETTKLAGVDTANVASSTAANTQAVEESKARINKLNQDIEESKSNVTSNTIKNELTKVQTTLTNLQAELQKDTNTINVQTLSTQVNILTETLDKLKRENYVGSETIQSQISQIRANVALTYLQTKVQDQLRGNIHIDSNLKMALQQLTGTAAQEKLNNIAQGWQHLSLQERQTRVQELLGNIQLTKMEWDQMKDIMDEVMKMIPTTPQRAPVGFNR